MEVISWFELLILLAAGILTGIVNTLAGSGTIISIGSMLFLGIPIDLANTTNRLGVLFQNVTGVFSIRKYGSITSSHVPLTALFATLLGALIGAYFAIKISTSSLEVVALVVIVGMIAYTIHDLGGSSKPALKIDFPSRKPLLKILLFLLIGFYGGFIQIGVGILLVIGLKAVYQGNWKESNYLKLLIILVYTVPTTIYFGLSGMIAWLPGMILSIGQIGGAYVAGWVVGVNEKVMQAIPYVILFMLVLTGLKILLF